MSSIPFLSDMYTIVYYSWELYVCESKDDIYQCRVVLVRSTVGSCMNGRLKSNRSREKSIHITMVEKDREYRKAYSSV